MIESLKIITSDALYLLKKFILINNHKNLPKSYLSKIVGTSFIYLFIYLYLKMMIFILTGLKKIYITLQTKK